MYDIYASSAETREDSSKNKHMTFVLVRLLTPPFFSDPNFPFRRVNFYFLFSPSFFVRTPDPILEGGGDEKQRYS